MSAIEEWLQARLSKRGFLARYPHYAAVLARLTPLDDPSVDVMAVSCAGGRFYLHVNRGFFDGAASMLIGVLLHEIHHLVLGHVTHPKFRGLARPDLLELAMEMSANEGIREALPPHVAIADYANVGICPGQSTLERYELLLRLPAKAARFVRKDNVDDHGPWLEGVRSGRRDEAGSAAAAELTRAFEDAWSKGSAAGTRPRHLVTDLDDVSSPPLDWKSALRAFVTMRRDRTFDYRRPSRRFPHRIGEVPGRMRRQRESLPSIVVAIDTSASMSRAELSAIGAQLEHLRQLATLHIVECDAEIQRSYPFEGKLGRVQGRGGTDLRPVFEPHVLQRLDARGVVYFTDGEGPFPPTPPPVPTLWVLTKCGAFGCPWGARATLRAGR